MFNLPSIIGYLVSLIIFVVFIHVAYWVTGATVSLLQLMIMYVIISVGNSVGNGVGAAIFDFISDKDKFK